MKQLFIFLSFFILFSGLTFVSASIIPSELQINYKFPQGEEVCRTVSLSSSESVVALIEDVWAESYDSDNNLHKFTYSSEDHGLTLNYIDTLDFAESGTIDLEVCVTGEVPGKYKGALIYSSDAEEGSSAVQYASWLSVIIQQTETPQQTQTSQSSGSGGGSGGGGSGITTISVQETEDETQEGILDYDDLGTRGEGSEGENNLGDGSITGKAVEGDSVYKIGILQIIPFIFIALLVGAKIYVRRKNKLLNFSSN